MRPSEVRYDSTRIHYYDVSTGEVLAGKEELSEYLLACPYPDSVYELGQLLKCTELPDIQLEREELDLEQWDRDKYKNYGRWLLRIVKRIDEPDPRKRILTRVVFDNARRLNLGPGSSSLVRRFGNLSSFYMQIGAARAKKYGSFDDWSQQDFVNYLKEIGGEEGRRPKLSDIEARAAENPNRPNRNLMYDRFRSIGGIRKLIELAGWVVPEFWEDKDYVQWGVLFMQANDGKLPGERPLAFLSARGLSPSKRPLVERFSNLENYQSEVAKSYWRAESDKNKERQRKLELIEKELISGTVPLEIFLVQPGEDVDENVLDQRVDEFRAKKKIGVKSFIELLQEMYNDQEIFQRYAKCRVVQVLLSDLELAPLIELCLGSNPNESFLTSLRKHNHALNQDVVESAALKLYVFDDIWPTDSLKKKLVLGEEYEEFCEVEREKRRQRERREDLAA